MESAYATTRYVVGAPARSIVQETFCVSVLAAAPEPNTSRPRAGRNVRNAARNRELMCLPPFSGVARRAVGARIGRAHRMSTQCVAKRRTGQWAALPGKSRL